MTSIESLSKSRYFGPCLFFLSELLFALSFSLMKLVSHSITLPLLMVLRVSPVLILLPFFYKKKLTFDFHSPKLLITRSVIGLVSIICLTYALKWGDYGKVNVLYSLGTVWAFVASMIFLKEKPHKMTILAIPVAILGIIFIFKPNANALNIPDLISLLGSFLTAFVYVSIRELRKTHNSISIVSCFYLTSLLILIIPAAITFKLPSGQALFICMWVAISGFFAQILMTLGYKHTPVTVSSSIKLTGIILSVCIGVIFFKDSLDLISGIGIALVIGSIYTVTRFQ